MVKVLQAFAILLTSVAMAAGWAHLLELPNKMALPREEYLIVQQIYQGWAFLGIAVVGALIATTALAALQYRQGAAFQFALVAAICIGLSLGVFFAVTFPVNQATQNWTVLPESWAGLRRRWEYSHATGALLYFVARSSLVFSLIFGRR
jgi:hypothetical protein